MHLPIHFALDQLSTSNVPFVELFRQDSLSVELYKPDKIDHQQPHDQDEVYIIVSGAGQFLNGESIIDFKPHDFLYVPAGVVHRFINFTDDFVTWVIFYGPKITIP